MLKSLSARSIALLLALCGALVVSGCTTPVGPVEVRRFHVMDQTPAATSGSIAVVPADGFDGNSLEFRAYAAAIARELSGLGYTVVDAGSSPDQLATLAYESQTRRTGNARSPVNVGVGGGGGSFGGRGGGFGGLGVGFNLGGGSSERIFTRMEVIIQRAADDVRLWEGQAISEAKPGSPEAEPQLGAAKIAAALFTGFPGESGATIEVD
ncbi:DUF4136 domain-containing protein [Alterisphingorhabdus coralli]|uniref:DUF4136 domain-containing protein n=1 Tax=Alterisphingorhabdus coralli TaxID=3071408 RepID=A0AA97F9K4_9SPHN|nr:DUF4136 domain-containing protein [Parasphingorhabdus sp. SCSIO 66989]WOE75772.1 hypothetical protein RB602_03395 [Parasphingorhabdus sp. SCSIO 66989]